MPVRRDPGPDAAGEIQRYVFIHVMKTGGRTLLSHLRANFEPDERYPHDKLDFRFDGDISRLEVDYLAGLPTERRRRIRVYAGHYPYVAFQLLGERFVTMTLLRDPVERTISLLRQFRRKDPWADAGPEYRPPTLEQVYANPVVFGPLVHNHQTKIFSMTEGDHPRTYMDDIEIDESRLDLAKRNLATVDIVGLTERYDEFLRELTNRTGWVVAPDVRKNVTPEDELQPVSDSLRRQIAEDNRIDIEFYEYARELTELRRRERPIVT
jgi:hypothetical protein